MFWNVLPLFIKDSFDKNMYGFANYRILFGWWSFGLVPSILYLLFYVIYFLVLSSLLTPFWKEKKNLPWFMLLYTSILY
jgi:hypothetical protein